MENYKNQKRTTGIEWASHTWNPFVGCSIKSSGCQNCYAMSLAKRLDLMGQTSYSGTWKTFKNKTIWTGKINKSSQSNMEKPYRIKNPSIIFVNSMSDFFHADAEDEWKLEALEIMADTKKHQYQVLTKRPENIVPFLNKYKINLSENIWIGTTVESKLVVNRIDIIRKIPARIKFLSVEPLISSLGKVNLKNIDWVISGGESGFNCRSMEFEWLNDLHIQTREQNVNHFFKQYGHAKNNPLWKEAENKNLNPYKFIEENDPIGKGGSKIFGKYIKEMPQDFTVADF